VGEEELAPESHVERFRIGVGSRVSHDELDPFGDAEHGGSLACDLEQVLREFHTNSRDFGIELKIGQERSGHASTVAGLARATPETVSGGSW
jgi:hypothetical protein